MSEKQEFRREAVGLEAGSSGELSIDALEGTTQREGLPRGYRMRADAHYVDQLADAAAGQPVRLIPTSQIDCAIARSEADLRPLIESVRAHGIVQPLIVRRAGARYAVVAGQKRLASAQMLQLQSVPCLVRDVDEAAAAALHEADNLHVQTPKQDDDGSIAAEVDAVVADHVQTVRKCTELLGGADAALNRGVMDLLKAHTWRAERLLGARRVVDRLPFAPEPERSLATIVDGIIDGFLPECRVSGIALRGDVRDNLSSSGLNGGQLFAGLAGAMLAVLPLARSGARPTVLVRISSREAGAIACEIVQNEVPVPADLAATFFTRADPRFGGAAAHIGALAAKAVAEDHGGTAAFERLDSGSRLLLVVPRRS